MIARRDDPIFMFVFTAVAVPWANCMVMLPAVALVEMYPRI